MIHEKLRFVLALSGSMLLSCGGTSSVSSSSETSKESEQSTVSSSEVSLSGESSSADSSESTSSEVSSSDSLPTVDEYSLRLVISCPDIGNNFGNIQVCYNYTGSTEADDYVWGHEISKEKLTEYIYTLNDLDGTKPLYFKLYIWDTALQNCYIGDKDGANFIFSASKEKEKVFIDFDYPTAGGNSLGVLTLDEQEETKSIKMDDISLSVHETAVITPTFDGPAEHFVATYEGADIRIDDNVVTGLKSGTSTVVTLTTDSGLTCAFKASVPTSAYQATSTRDASKDFQTSDWFTSTSVDEISNMGKDFYNGVDISSVAGLYEHGAKFYNSDGVEQSLFYILKEAGVNWVRVKLFVDPYTSKGTSYGAGESDFTHALWTLDQARKAGFKLLLDFHYSDYWTHPGQQILPKAWAGAKTSDELASYIKSYTKETLLALKEKGALPEMVQLGNEISSGDFMQLPGDDSESFSSYEPNYKVAKTNFSQQGVSGSANMVKYLSAASEGVTEVSSDIKKVIHWAKGSTFSAAVINKFYNALTSVDYDYAGLSIYPYYCFPKGKAEAKGGIDEFNTVLSGLSINKPWFVAETSYPFSGDSWVYENGHNVFEGAVNNWSTDKDMDTMRNNYPFTMAGQAKMMHDLTVSVVDNAGLGIFYWEPAWIPVYGMGWAGAGSPTSWSNQGFFSFNGKATANLALFAKMSPHF